MAPVSGCHRWIPREQPLATVHAIKKDRVTQTQIQNTFPLFLCLAFKCVQSVSLCHYQIGHTHFTEEMKVLLLLVTSAFLMAHVPSRWPQRLGLRRAIITTLCTHSGSSSCDRMLVWMFETKRVFTRREKHEFVCLPASISQNMSVWTYGLTSMKTLQRPVRRDQCPGSGCQTQLTEPFYFYPVALQMSRRRHSSVLNCHIWTTLDLLSVKLKQKALWKECPH